MRTGFWQWLSLHLGTDRIVLGTAVASVLLAFPVAAILTFGGAVTLHANNAAAFFNSVFLGPLLVLCGAWLYVRRGQALGVLLSGLGLLFALDGVFATFFGSLPLLLLTIVSFCGALLRWRRLSAVRDAGSPG
jgi:hypothetical protein